MNFTGLAGMVNVTVYKTKPIFTGLRHSKLSSFFLIPISNALKPLWGIVISHGILDTDWLII